MGLFSNWFKPKRPVVSASTPKIEIKSGRGVMGDSARMLGVNLKTPQLENKSGITVQDSYLGESYISLYKNFIRKPNGSESYLIKSINDPKVRYLIDEVFPLLPDSVGHDITWPPQLDIADIHNWITPRLKRIAVFNEPPMHIGSNKEFSSAADCTTKMIGVYNAVSDDLKKIMYFHTGKPEVVKLGLVSPSGIKTHSECLQLLSDAVRSNKLPARIATTHKLEYGYATDRLKFYRDLINDYKSYFGDNVSVLFHEYKWMGDDNDTLDQVMLVAEFWLIMSRLIFETNNNIEGGSYHCLADPGRSNIFGLDNPIDREWVGGGMLNLWNLFSDVFVNGTYVDTTFINKPDNVQIEAFEYGTYKKINYLYTNIGSTDVEIILPDNNVNLKYINSDLIPKLEPFRKVLKANTVGVIY
jgi:hypothetical protein